MSLNLVGAIISFLVTIYGVYGMVVDKPKALLTFTFGLIFLILTGARAWARRGG